jgi:hypothetical protein
MVRERGERDAGFRFQSEQARIFLKRPSYLAWLGSSSKMHKVCLEIVLLGVFEGEGKVMSVVDMRV